MTSHKALYDAGHAGKYACFADRGKFYGIKETDEEAATLCRETGARDTVIGRIGCYPPLRAGAGMTYTYNLQRTSRPPIVPFIPFTTQMLADVYIFSVRGMPSSAMVVLHDMTLILVTHRGAVEGAY